MYELELSKFQQELGKIKQDLLIESAQNSLSKDDTDDYQVATKIDLLVSRLMRVLERE